MKVVRDWRGNPIRLGSRVIWSTRQSSHHWMNEGVVTSIEPIEPEYAHGPAYKIGVRKVREQRANGASSTEVTTRTVYPSVDRMTAVGFFTAGVDRELPVVLGAEATERMVAS